MTLTAPGWTNSWAVGLPRGYDPQAPRHCAEDTAHHLPDGIRWQMRDARPVSVRFADEEPRWYEEDGVVVLGLAALLPHVEAAAGGWVGSGTPSRTSTAPVSVRECIGLPGTDRRSVLTVTLAAAMAGSAVLRAGDAGPDSA